jgi:6-phosphofructokinase 1
VPVVYGIPYGYRGLDPKYGLEPILLTPEKVDHIHDEGGTILGSSRGNQDVSVMVDTLARMNINMLFCVGGDGTLRGAHKLSEEVLRRKLNISVIGIPKTIDNDISFIDKTFGFETAVYATNPVITCAHNEAKGAYNGIGLVHVMGRDSGFIAAYAALANSDVNYCLIPEEKFTLEDGEDAFLPHLFRRLEKRQHAVVLIAEGAGQDLFHPDELERDASGNIKYKNIGRFLKSKILEYAEKNNLECSLKYFDPSYSIRSLPAHGTDAVLCSVLAQNAVSAAMSGCIDVVVGRWNGAYTLVPISISISKRKKVNLNGPVWQSVRSMTWPDYE